MGAFREIEESETLRPTETLVVSPNGRDPKTGRLVEYWSPRWEPRPVEEVCCGVRPLTGLDDDYIRESAARHAWKTLPGRLDDEHHVARTDVYNDELMRLAVARATCDPNDATRPWDVWQGPSEEMVRVALTREGVKALYDAIERVSISLSPVRPEADDEDVYELADLVAAGALDRMPTARASRARRLALFLLEELRLFPAGAPSELDSAPAAEAASP